jgi:hypothetical protein
MQGFSGTNTLIYDLSFEYFLLFISSLDNFTNTGSSLCQTIALPEE